MSEKLCVKPNLHWAACRGQGGFTLVGAIIMVAFLGIFAYVIFGVVNNSLSIRRIVETGTSYKDIDSAFRAALAEEARRLLNPYSGTCAGAPLIISHPIGTEGTSFKTSNAIGAWPTGAPARHVAAIGRCRRPFRSMPTNQDYYFCVEFSGINNTNFAASSFNGAPKAIAEVRARAINLDTGAPMTCAQYKLGHDQFAAGRPDKSGNSTLEIQYSLYWQSRGKPVIFKSNNGSFYAPSYQ